MVNIGDTAPAFTLRATDKREVSLSDYAGKTVILAFYPGAFTGVCDKEMCAFQDNMAALNDADAVVLGISVDSPWANAEFARKYNLEFELLSDLDREAVNAYDAAFVGLGGIDRDAACGLWQVRRQSDRFGQGGGPIPPVSAGRAAGLGRLGGQAG